MEERAGIEDVRKTRLKLNKLFAEVGWRLFDDVSDKANIVLEPNIKLTTTGVDGLGVNFESVKNGFVDFLLLDESGSHLAGAGGKI